MSIENTLERIATALEKIASVVGQPVVTKDSAKSEVLKTETPKTRPGKKVEEKKEDVKSEDDSFYNESEEEAKDEDEKPLKWPEVNKALFGMLGEVRDKLGQDEAKAICATLMKNFSGGQKFAEGAVKPEKYKALMNVINQQLKALEEIGG